MVELETLAGKTRVEIAKAQMDLIAHHNKNTNAAGNLKRTLAQILTVKKELEGKK